MPKSNFESERNFGFCMSSISVVRNLLPTEFRLPLLGRMAIKIDRFLNLKFRNGQNRFQKQNECVV